MAFLLALMLMAVGAWLGGRRGRLAPTRPIPVLRWGFRLMALGFGLIPLSGLLRVDALGWLGGLSLMFMLPTLLPFVLGYTGGWAMGAKRLPLPRLWSMPSGPEKLPQGSPREAPYGELPTSASTATATATAPANTAAPRGDPAGLLLAMGSVAAGFMIVIGAGFAISGDAGPPVLTQALVPGLVLMAVVIGAALWRRHHRAAKSAGRSRG